MPRAVRLADIEPDERVPLLFLGGGPAGAQALKGLLAFRDIFQIFVWPDYLTTLNYQDRFYGAWHFGIKMKEAQMIIARAFQNSKKMYEGQLYGLRSDNFIIPPQYGDMKIGDFEAYPPDNGKPTFTIDRLEKTMDRLKIKVLVVACFGRYIPNSAIVKVGGEVDACGKLVKPGLAFLFHPGFTHKKEFARELPKESRGKDILRSLVTSRVTESKIHGSASGRPWRVYGMYLTDVVDGGEILMETGENYLPDWSRSELANTAPEVNARIIEACHLTASTYPAMIRRNFVREVIEPECLFARKISAARALSFGYERRELIRAGYKLNVEAELEGFGTDDWPL